jgi:2-iminobutanoate/2-iminopropanoate deaminase
VKAVDTGLPSVSPISWATMAGEVLCTAHVPLRPDGTFETGSVELQLRQVFANLKASVEAAGGSLRDVLQVVVYLLDMRAFGALNLAWTETFADPRPSRAVIGCSALAVDGIEVCITATAVISPVGREGCVRQPRMRAPA